MQDKYLEYHNKRFEFYKDNVKSLWGSEYSQQVRFKVFAKHFDLRNANILDVGCGFGDLFGFLKANNINFSNYSGFDINENHLGVAQKKYPAANFQLVDLLKDETTDQFDFVFASGIFFLKCDNWTEYFLKMVKKMFKLSKKGIAFNLLSCHSVSPDDVSYYSKPKEIVALLTKELSPFIILDHSYKQNDYTLFIYKHSNEI
ncbi:MAG: class I SAM-dependent methyltransferase [Rhodothermaceae bacterium]